VTPEGLLRPNRAILVTGRSRQRPEGKRRRGEADGVPVCGGKLERWVAGEGRGKVSGISHTAILPAGFWLVLDNARSSLW